VTSRLLAVSLVVALAGCTTPADGVPESVPSTFSIAAVDTRTGEVGVAVQSRFIAVGAVVPWAKARVGAVATQSFANTTYGPEGLDLLAAGVTAADVVAKLTEKDPRRARRQVGVVSASGGAATFTGDECMEWAGGLHGEGFCVQGNILAGEKVVAEMARTFRAAEGELGERLIAALEAGQAAGGDKRGQQSAAVLVVREGWGYGGLNDRYRDLRVDDHPRPIEELRRVYAVHKRVFPRPSR
jgi:uncharacterized Ntn-hydrolase superfamily protein